MPDHAINRKRTAVLFRLLASHPLEDLAAPQKEEEKADVV